MLETITETVEAINAKGVKVAAAWHNSRQWHDVPRPAVGQAVRLQVERGTRGTYINDLEVLDGAEPADGANVERAPNGRERTITRLAVLKAAAEFLANRPDAKSADVLTVAERWETRVLR